MGGGVGVLWLRWYMAERRARTSSLPEESRERQHCPFCLCDSPRLEALLQGRAVDFPCSVNWYKKHKNSSSLWSSVQSVVWNEGIWKTMVTLRIFWGKLCAGHWWWEVRWGEGGERGIRVAVFTRRWGFASHWSHRHGCRRRRLTCRRRHHPDWGCGGPSGWRSCWLDPPAWSGQSMAKQLNPLLLSGVVQQFGTFANLLSCRLWGEKINTTLTVCVPRRWLA